MPKWINKKTIIPIILLFLVGLGWMIEKSILIKNYYGGKDIEYLNGKLF